MGAIAQAVASIIGKANVVAGEDSDRLGLPDQVNAAIAALHGPDCIAFPPTQAALAEVMTCAHQHRWRVLPCGGASKVTWGGLVQGADLVISTARLNQVIEHAIGDLTITAEAGASFAAVQQQLAKTQQFLALDPAYPHRATLGGIVSTADAGSLRQRYGGVRDMLIGVSFVRHDGQMAKAGGRVVKNVAGYDLMKLMTGAYGTLGILTQLTFRTYPMQADSQTVLLTGTDEAIHTLAAAVRQSALTPVAMDVLSPGLVQELGAAPGYGLAVQFQSIAAGVTEQVNRLGEIAASWTLARQTFTADAEMDFWQGIQRLLFPPEADVEWAIALKIGTLPTTALPSLEKVAALFPGVPWRGSIHASSGIGTVRLGTAASADSLHKLRQYCQQQGGYLTLLEAPTELKQSIDPWGLSPDVQGLMQRLKQAFDPNYCLSPGRFF